MSVSQLYVTVSVKKGVFIISLSKIHKPKEKYKTCFEQEKLKIRRVYKKHGVALRNSMMLFSKRNYYFFTELRLSPNNI